MSRINMTRSLSGEDPELLCISRSEAKALGSEMMDSAIHVSIDLYDTCLKMSMGIAPPKGNTIFGVPLSII